MVIKIVSSGQTGVERAALDVALENDIACGGWCPKGRLAEDGPVDRKYPLVEIESSSSAARVEANIRDCDGTLILTWSNLQGSSLKTAGVATRLKKPLFVLKSPQPNHIAEVETWVMENNVRVLHVTGPKASDYADAYSAAREFLVPLLVEQEGEEVLSSEP